MAQALVEDIASLRNEVISEARSLKVDNFLSLVATAELVNTFVDIALRRSDDVTRTDMAILHALTAQGGSMKPTEVARRVMRSPHAITKAIDKLESQGKVSRDPIGLDRRTRTVSITQEGLDLVRRSIPRRQQVSARALSCLDDREMRLLGDILKKLRKHLSAEIASLQSK